MTNHTPARQEKPLTHATGCIARLAAVAALTLASPFIATTPARAQTRPGDSGLTGVDQPPERLEEGLGADQRVTLTKAAGLIEAGKYAEAERLIDQVIAHFETLTADAKRDYVSVANREQFNRYRKEHAGGREPVWVDWGYGYALLKKGWIASSRSRWKDAGIWLDRSIKVRPYSAEAHGERGYALNREGRYQEAAKVYSRAVDLARADPFEKPFEPMALRGLSYAQIELKDLAGVVQEPARLAEDRAEEPPRPRRAEVPRAGGAEAG